MIYCDEIESANKTSNSMWYTAYHHIDPDIFTPLRVGWPPSHRRSFLGPWQAICNLHTWLLVFLNICACYLHLCFKKLRSHPQPGPSRATISPPLGILPMGVFFSFFPRVGASQAREFQTATTTTPRKTVQTTFCTVICMFFHKILQSPCFSKCVCMFLQWFPSKHGNLHICRHKTVPKHHFLQCFQFPCLPKPLKTPLFTPFSSIFPCANAAGQLKHIYKKSFKNIVFFSVFTMFSVKNTVIYMFFGIKSVQNTGFCSVFNALASKNHSKYRYLQCFFICVRFSIAGSLPKWPKFHFNTKNRRKDSHPKTRSRCEIVFAPPPRCEIVFAPPPPS